MLKILRVHAGVININIIAKIKIQIGSHSGLADTQKSQLQITGSKGIFHAQAHLVFHFVS
ncbi:hypothetical protein SDC9_183865 [bioreactor metagenome]|uniref:Uncharacterized protein n=1 Tax=bioreactor metagenome TaxID=1076179 RepID=A0A645HCV8_9ZZZZ